MLLRMYTVHIKLFDGSGVIYIYITERGISGKKHYPLKRDLHTKKKKNLPLQPVGFHKKGQKGKNGLSGIEEQR